MKKIIVTSDSHCDTYALKEIAKIHPDAIAYLHAGDSQDYEVNLYPFVTVKGNNDFFLKAEKEEVFWIEEYKIMVAHGHTYNVSLGVDMLVDEALSRGVNIVMYGHTHRPHLEIRDDITIINCNCL